MANRQLIKLSRFNWDSLRILLENLRQPLFDSRKCISIFPSEFHLWIWSNFNVYIWYFTLLKYLFIDIFVMKIFFVFRYFYFFHRMDVKRALWFTMSGKFVIVLSTYISLFVVFSAFSLWKIYSCTPWWTTLKNHLIFSYV